MGSNSQKYKFIKVKKDKDIETITLSRPEVLNALNIELVEELINEIKRVEEDDSIRFIILTGASDKAFCTGADLTERSVFEKDNTETFLDNLNNVANSIEDSKKIYIASIDGYALGGGLEIALACDFRLATEKSQFALPEVTIGVIPGAGGTARIVKTCGFTNAAKVLLSGERINASKAKDFGMLHEVVQDRSALANKLEEYLIFLIKTAPLSLSKAKECMNNYFRTIRKDLLEKERENYNSLLDTEDRKEGLSAFKQKRDPNFKGK